LHRTGESHVSLHLFALSAGLRLHPGSSDPGAGDGAHELVDVVGVDAEDAGSVAVGAELAGGDAASECLDAHLGAFGGLGEALLGLLGGHGVSFLALQKCGVGLSADTSARFSWREFE
jgi:hypothetical protein